MKTKRYSTEQIIGIQMIHRETLDASLVRPREVVKGVVLANAHAFILFLF